MCCPHITIVVCTYNRKDLLREALQCMLKQKSKGKFSFDLVVIDDGSTDGTHAVVEEISVTSPVPVNYFHTEGRGVSHARNIGIQKAGGEWIAFFDQDQLAEPNWLEELFSTAQATGVFIVDGPRDLALSQPEMSMLSPICRRVLGERLGPLTWTTREGPNTGNVLMHRKTFDLVGGFEESITWGGEDLDFFQRAKALGFVAGYAPNAIVHHLIPAQRLTKGFFRWNSLRCGTNFAMMDFKYHGLLKTAFFCIGRLFQLLTVNGPRYFIAAISKNQSEQLGFQCLLWRTIGYVRMASFLIAPNLFPQAAYFSSMEFRKETIASRVLHHG